MLGEATDADPAAPEAKGEAATKDAGTMDTEKITLARSGPPCLPLPHFHRRFQSRSLAAPYQLLKLRWRGPPAGQRRFWSIILSFKAYLS